MRCFVKAINEILLVVDKTYCMSREERAKIHEVEWIEDLPFSILGEVELLHDKTVGIAHHCVKNQNVESNLILNLERENIFRSKAFMNWIANNGDKYPNYLIYLLTINSLRLAVCEFLKAE